jgi:hypothetical protein
MNTTEQHEQLMLLARQTQWYNKEIKDVIARIQPLLSLEYLQSENGAFFLSALSKQGRVSDIVTILGVDNINKLTVNGTSFLEFYTNQVHNKPHISAYIYAEEILTFLDFGVKADSIKAVFKLMKKEEAKFFLQFAKGSKHFKSIITKLSSKWTFQNSDDIEEANMYQLIEKHIGVEKAESLYQSSKSCIYVDSMTSIAYDSYRQIGERTPEGRYHDALEKVFFGVFDSPYSWDSGSNSKYLAELLGENSVE